VTDGTADIHYLGIVDYMVNPEEVKDVLAVIGLYEDGDEDCNNALIDHETGLNQAAWMRYWNISGSRIRSRES
jgi:hypothetical protein